jgi:hypothetical protein
MFRTHPEILLSQLMHVRIKTFQLKRTTISRFQARYQNRWPPESHDFSNSPPTRVFSGQMMFLAGTIKSTSVTTLHMWP